MFGRIGHFMKKTLSATEELFFGNNILSDIFEILKEWDLIYKERLYGNLVSLVFILILIYIHLHHSQIRKGPARILMHSMIPLCFGYLFKCILGLLHMTHSGIYYKVACTFVIYYLSYSTFFWNNAIACDTWIRIRKSSTVPFYKTTLLYYIYGWGAPLIPLVIFLRNLENFLLFFTSTIPRCWTNTMCHRYLTITYAPSLLLIIVSTVIYSHLTCYLIFGSPRGAANVQTANENKARYRLHLRFFILMSLTLLMDLCISIYEQKIVNMYSPYSYYFPDILDGLQGVLIFLLYCFEMCSRSNKIVCESGTVHNNQKEKEFYTLP